MHKETRAERHSCHPRFAISVVRRSLVNLKPENKERLQSLATLPPVSDEAMLAELPPLSLLTEVPGVDGKFLCSWLLSGWLEPL